jgi:hypothetical protein
VNHFLKILKPYYDAGFINALGVVAVFAVVLVALLPHFLRWLRRPKLQVAIPGNYFAPRQDFSNEQIGVYTIAALFILRNAGRSDASRIRAVATDFYKFLPGPKYSCDHVRSSQNPLEGSEIDLPAGFSAPILLCSFTSAGRFKSGFVIGRSIKCSFSFASPTIPSGVKFSPPQDLDAGTYVARVVISGSNVLPTANFMTMVLGEATSPELGEEIKLGVAGRRERRAVRRADKRRQKFQLSRG